MVQREASKADLLRVLCVPAPSKLQKSWCGHTIHAVDMHYKLGALPVLLIV